MVVVHVDISFNGFLRKWGLGWIRSIKDRLISWRYVQPLSLEDAVASDTVSLSITRRRSRNCPAKTWPTPWKSCPARSRRPCSPLLDSEKAAETLMEAEPRAQRQIIANLRQERARTILTEMSTAQLADLFSVLPHDDKMELLGLLPKDQAAKIETILSEREVTARTLMSTGCVTMPKETTVGDALRQLRSSQFDHDMVSYIYITAEPDRMLMGVVDLREMVLAPDTATLE